MIQGQVNANGEPILRLQIRGFAGTHFLVDAMVDTGFFAQVGLPESMLRSLGFEPNSRGSVVMADGSAITCDTYPIEMEWGGSFKPVTAWAFGDLPLVGCELLRGYELKIHFEDAGAVEIQKL
jgi:predicted aspartyl protease